MNNQSSFYSENRSEIIREILKRLHRVKVMLWAFDYLQAAEELSFIQTTYSSVLEEAKHIEKALLEVKKRYNKSSARSAQARLALENAENTAIANTLQSMHLEIIESNDFAISAVARTIEQYSKKVQQASENLADLSNQSTKLTENPMISYKARGFFSGDNKITYRSYSLNRERKFDVAKLKTDIKNVLNNDPIEIEQDDNDFPFLLRFFIENALVEIAFLDLERWTTEITYGLSVEPNVIFQKILSVVNDAGKE